MNLRNSYYFILIGLIDSSCTAGSKNEYRGRVYLDEVKEISIQAIPGKLQCEYYDLGGEGIAYHDTDTINSGSGNLNKSDGYFNNFRKSEAVDISYTKFHEAIDNSQYNQVKQTPNQLYVGWTLPGEWMNYTVDVKSAGIYQIGIMYTANDDGQIALSTPESKTGPLDIVSTFHLDDTIQWRQWHHWNYLENIGEVELKKGIQTITLSTISKGQMNYDFIEFSLKKRF